MAATEENGRGGSASPRAGGGGEDEAGSAEHADARQDVGGKHSVTRVRNLKKERGLK